MTPVPQLTIDRQVTVRLQSGPFTFKTREWWHNGDVVVFYVLDDSGLNSGRACAVRMEDVMSEWPRRLA